MPTRATGVGYLVAVLATAVAVSLRSFLDPWLEDRLPLVTMFMAVAASVWFGGYRPAILTAVLGYLACNISFMEPRGRIDTDVPALIGMVAYFVTCAVIIGFAEAMRIDRFRGRQHRDLLKVTLDSIGDAVITTDTLGRITFLNPVAESLTKWTRREASGKPLEEVFRIINEHTREPVENPAAQALREGATVRLANHTVLIRKDGSEIPIDDSASPIRDNLGLLSGCVLVFRDVTDRKRATQAQALLAGIVSASNDAIVSKTLDGVITSWNAAAEHLFGYTAAEAVGQPVTLIIPPERQQEDRSILERVRRGDRVQHFETVRVSKQGKRIDVSLTVSPIRDSMGEIIGASKTARDITDRKRAEAAQSLLAGIVSASDDAIVSKTLDGIILTWNAAAERLFGYTSVEAVGRSIHLIIPPELHDEEKYILNQVRRGERVDHYETVRVSKQGRRLQVSLSISPMRDSAGRIVGASKVARDITQRKQTEESLRNVERHLQIVTDSMSAPVTRCSRDLRYLWVSKHYADWLGLPAEEIIGRPIADVIGQDALDRLRPHIEQVLSGQEVRYEDQISFQGLGPRWIHAVYTPTYGADGVPDGWVAVVMDIDHRKHIEDALRDADRRKDEFLATLAHELRNPLAPMRNSLEIMKRAGANMDMIAQARDTIDRQMLQMERLIEDLLDVSRITHNRLGLRKQRVSLESVVHQAVESSRPLAENSGHTIRLSLPSEPIDLNGDPIRLAQVFGNLLNNACKYTEGGGEIVVAAERQGSDAVVSVKDNGIGIPREMLPHVFDTFTQVDRTLERSQSGLGIGLMLVKQIVGMHGGSVEAKSEGAGRGSEFIVRLPILVETLESPAEENPPGTRITEPQTPRRILVVDDNKDSADSLAMFLRMAGHEILLAYDGVEAFQAAENFRPDAVLLDIGLPKLNGFDVCRRIREQLWGKSVVVIALTGWGQDQDRRKSIEAGFDGHMVKPVDPVALMKLLSSLSPGERGELQEY